MNPNTTFDLITLDGGVNNQLPADAGIFEVCGVLIICRLLNMSGG
jgi:hypothetical protein